MISVVRPGTAFRASAGGRVSIPSASSFTIWTSARQPTPWHSPQRCPPICCLLRIPPFSAGLREHSRWIPQTLTRQQSSTTPCLVLAPVFSRFFHLDLGCKLNQATWLICDRLQRLPRTE